jgi:hypothetical protein
MAEPFTERAMSGDDSRLYRIGVMLLNGYGYNWYRLDNRMRADDLLIRGRAGGHLAGAAARLRDLEGRYRRKYLPPPTREHPEPPPDHLAAVRQFRDAAERLGEVETKVRGGAVPANDKVWQRHRDEIDTLQRLGECDAILLAGTKELEDFVAALAGDTVIEPALARELDDRLARLAAVLARRSEIVEAL